MWGLKTSFKDVSQLRPSLRPLVTALLELMPELHNSIRLTGGVLAARRGESTFELEIIHTRTPFLSIEVVAGGHRFAEEDGEVVVLVGHHHEHCAAEEAQALICAFLMERLVLVEYVDESNWMRIWFAEPADIETPRLGGGSYPPNGCLFPADRKRVRNVCKVYSWLGTYDMCIGPKDQN